MFDMFKGMGAMAGLMRNLPKIREEMEQLQKRLGEIVVEGDAGAGMVKVKCNGRMEITAVTINEEAQKDRELLEDLIRAAVNQALQKAKQQVSEETNKMAAGLGLPAGMNLPGLQ
jgi:DNA-binding YbaB/EbfC family protein